MKMMLTNKLNMISYIEISLSDFLSYFSCVQLFFKMLASGAEVNFNTYSILLKNLLSSGNWRKYLEVSALSASLYTSLVHP